MTSTRASSSNWPSGSGRGRVSEGDRSDRGKTVLAVDESVDLGASPGGIRPQHQQGAPLHASVVSLPSEPIDVEAIEDDVQLLPSSTSSTTFPQGRNQPRTRRNRPVTVVLDEDSDGQVGSSGMSDESEIVNNNRQKRPPKRPLINCEVYENYQNVECSYKSKGRMMRNGHNWLEWKVLIDGPEGTQRDLRNACSRHGRRLFPVETLDTLFCRKRKCVTDNPEPQKAALKEPAFTCAICLGHITEETSTICGHIFCHGCIKTAIQTHRKCPTCRKFLTVKNIHRVYLPTAQ